MQSKLDMFMVTPPPHLATPPAPPSAAPPALLRGCHHGTTVDGPPPGQQAAPLPTPPMSHRARSPRPLLTPLLTSCIERRPVGYPGYGKLENVFVCRAQCLPASASGCNEQDEQC